MPAFDPAKYYDRGNYSTSIEEARRDLEADYPGCYVLIYQSETGKVEVIRESGKVHGHFELKALEWFARTRGYEFYVFMQGAIAYDGHTG